MIKQKKGLFIIGTRPEIIKTYPLVNKLDADILFTGQHFDNKMSKNFFSLFKNKEIITLDNNFFKKKDLIPNLITNEISKKIKSIKPKYVFIQGDTNSVLYGATAAKSNNIPVFYLESGLRTFDINQIEEYNRVITSHLADLNFCNHVTNRDNLIKEGINKRKIFVSGSTVYSAIKPFILKENEIRKKNGEHILLTIHRPENTDDFARFNSILSTLNSLGEKIIFPYHPRIKKYLKNESILKYKNVKIVEPQTYKIFLESINGSKFVISDSGGLQEECMILKKRLIIPRRYSERPELLNKFNFLAEDNKKLLDLSKKILNEKIKITTNKNIYGEDEVINKIITKVNDFSNI